MNINDFIFYELDIIYLDTLIESIDDNESNQTYFYVSQIIDQTKKRIEAILE